MNSCPSVVIVQRRLAHYRVPLFIKLRELLSERGLTLRLLVGEPTPQEALKRDDGFIDWAESMPTRYWWGACWQPFSKPSKDADLVIVTQENRLLYNLFAITVSRPRRLAFWGHGRNMQSTHPSGFKERYKRWTTKKVDWWFAYTQMSADFVVATGFPINRVTVLNNAIDTSELRRQLESVSCEESAALRRSLGFRDGPIGVFVGSLYSNKRLEFLFQAAEKIRRVQKDFHLLIIGEGPERGKVRAWCNAHSWSYWAGVKFGKEKAVYLSNAQVILNPGLVGLGILDSFVCCAPILTTDCGIHSPEISYLSNGRNGIMTANNLEDYVSAAVHLFRDPEAMKSLRAGCANVAEKYTVENMALRFADGIETALSCC